MEVIVGPLGCLWVSKERCSPEKEDGVLLVLSQHFANYPEDLPASKVRKLIRPVVAESFSQRGLANLHG
jgi:hypothetical protein